jgi:hypothetical protein
MPGRTATFVSAIFASVLAGIPLATISHGATPAADDCLSAPSDQASHGGHWYYRIDHATKRHCWHLKDGKQSAAAEIPPSAKPMSPNAEAATQRSISDAHAELPAQAAVGQPKRSDELAPAIAADASIATTAAEPQRSVVASRWPERSEPGSSTVPVTAADNSAVTSPPDSDATATAGPAAATLAAADSSPEKSSESIQTLLLIIVGALALAGLIGSAVFRFGRLRWTGLRKIRIDRQAIWQSANIDRRSLPVDLNSGARISRNDIPWELRTEDDPSGRIADMLARLARSATQ